MDNSPLLVQTKTIPMELLEDADGTAVLLHAEPEAAQLQVGLEPQPLVVGLLQRIQRDLVEVLQVPRE